MKAYKLMEYRQTKIEKLLQWFGINNYSPRDLLMVKAD